MSDIYSGVAKNQITNGENKPNRPYRMIFSEMITLLVYYHQFGCRTFKWFYQNHVRKYWLSVFPSLLSYRRFIELIPQIVGPLRHRLSWKAAMELRKVLLLSILRLCASVKIAVSFGTKSLLTRLAEGNHRRVGFMALNYI